MFDENSDSGDLDARKLVESPMGSVRSAGFRFSTDFSDVGSSLDLSQEVSESPPKTPPPSAETTSEENSANDQRALPSPTDTESDFDDSHSKLTSDITTGYHSMIDYGTV